MNTWDQLLREALTRATGPEVAEAAFDDPDADLFELGLRSLQAFELLDDLADAGTDHDFGEFTRAPTVNFLRNRSTT